MSVCLPPITLITNSANAMRHELQFNVTWVNLWSGSFSLCLDGVNIGVGVGSSGIIMTEMSKALFGVEICDPRTIFRVRNFA